MSRAVIDAVMEKTVLPSFSRLGTCIRSRLFKWQALDSYSLKGRVVVITGATSGIGEAGAHQYAKMGATLVVVARNAQKSDTLIANLVKTTGNTDIHAVTADLGSQEQTRKAADEIATRWPIIDVLAHNAGALFNQRKQAANGTDLSVELMVATPFLLTGLLMNNLKAAADNPQSRTPSNSPSPARVLTMSSGGMYTEGLNVEHLQMRDANYQGARQYARAKRAQVVLNEVWADKISADNVVFHAMHPGWVNTPGINDALPGFSRILNPLGLLRTADEGADTLVWLSADETPLRKSGLFWHDRQERDIDMTNKTRQADTPALRDELWRWCETHTGWRMNT
ncbi:MAG: SDR family NAD(P)-dependent oxidoreductase [Granulosicoccus sp.]